MRKTVTHKISLDRPALILLTLIAIGLVGNLALQLLGSNQAHAQFPNVVTLNGNLEISPPRNGSFRVQCVGCR